MAGADMYIAYKNQSGALYVGNYLGSGPVMPALRPKSAVTSTSSTSSDLNYDFCRNEASKLKLSR